MASDITDFLLSAQSLDAEVRNKAETTLGQLQQQSLPRFLLSLTVELSNDAKPIESRTLAGIILKNFFNATEAATKEYLTQQWVAIDISSKTDIKRTLLTTLGSVVLGESDTAPRVIAKIASIEIPRKEWPDLVELLDRNMTQLDEHEFLKKNILQTVVYMCEEISDEDLENNQVNSVLKVVAKGMSVSEKNPEVRFAATKVMLNALDFARTKFVIDQGCKDLIMEAIFTAALAEETKIKEAAFECLPYIASHYYYELQPYITRITGLTHGAIKGDEEAVAIQAVEFWSCICDEEWEIQGYKVFISDSSSPHSDFMKKAFPDLVPMLLERILRKTDEDGIWNLAIASGTCLGLVVRSVGDAVVPLLDQFILGNIYKADWQSREAAIFAFGSILKVPSIETISRILMSGIDILLEAMKDQNIHLKDTTAWTLSRFFELLQSTASHLSVITPDNLPNIVSVLLENLNNAPQHIAEKLCVAIYYLAPKFSVKGGCKIIDSFRNMVKSLMDATERNDISDSKLRYSAFETLDELIRCSNLEETSGIIADLIPGIRTKLENLIRQEYMMDDMDRENQGNFIASLCGVFQVIIEKLSSFDGTKSIIVQETDNMMTLLLEAFNSDNSTSTAREESMLAIGSLVHASGTEFLRHMPDLHTALKKGLEGLEEYQVCAISVGIVGYIFREFGNELLHYYDEIIKLLDKDLSDNTLHLSVKPLVFSCFGDIAIGIGNNFKNYVNSVMHQTEGALKLLAEPHDGEDEIVKFRNDLMLSICKAYSGILQGLKYSDDNLMVDHAPKLLKFYAYVENDQDREERLTKAAVAFLGDVADAIGPKIKKLIEVVQLRTKLIKECEQSVDPKIAIWTTHALQRGHADRR